MGMLSYIKEEIKVIRERDPAIKSNMEVLLYPSFKAILCYRVAHRFYVKRHYFLARWVSQRAVRKTGIEIHPGAKIGKGLFIDHGSGVIIGETAELGDNVTLYQGVTLGGTGKEKGKRHPTLKDNVMVSAGAKVLGSFTIGENSKIGAGSVVLKEVPPNCTVVGVPGRIVRRDNERIPRMDLDQVHLPDPITTDIQELQADNIRLHRQVKELKKSIKELKKEEKRWLTGDKNIGYNNDCVLKTRETYILTTAAGQNGRCGRRAQPVLCRVQEVYRDEAYLSAQEAPALQGAWLP